MITVSVSPPDTCAHCGEPFRWPPARTGRTRVYCSDVCRKAAWDARRTTTKRGVAVKVVERVVIQEHNLTECSRRVAESPVACTNVFHALCRLAEAHRFEYEPRWARAFIAFQGIYEVAHLAPRGDDGDPAAAHHR